MEPGIMPKADAAAESRANKSPITKTVNRAKTPVPDERPAISNKTSVTDERPAISETRATPHHRS
jgi:hypothetical protein